MSLKTDKYNKFLEKLIIPSDVIFEYFKKLIIQLHKVENIYYQISRIMLTSGIYRILRLITFPLHWTWIWAYKLSIRPKSKRIPFDDGGVMVITGIPGAGKSSISYEIMNRSLALNGKPWYVNSKMERPRYDENLGIYYTFHAQYEFTDFWSNGKMNLVPNKLIFGGLVVEEYHRILNYRESNTLEYKQKYVPFSDYAVTVRKEIKNILIITQMNRVDVQLMNLCTHITNVKIDIGFKYQDWMKTGIWKLQPLGWYCETYSVNQLLSGNFENIKPKKWYFKSEYSDWDYFDTYAERDDHNHLPMHYPKNTRKVRLSENSL